MSRPLALGLVVGARFGLLLGLALWVGVAVGLLVVTPILARSLPRRQARALAAALAMAGSRLAAALVVGPRFRAKLGRREDANADRNAPVSGPERGGLARLEAASRLLLALEVCLGLYALFAVS